MSCCDKFLSRMCRRKTLPRDTMETPLNRCLNTMDLTLLGVGNMVGAGVFIISGFIAKEKAGPGVVLCYLLAGIAMFLSSVCYAEFGARVPRAGSAYTFTYLTLGELCGFVVGWDVVLKRMLGGAAAARGWSTMFDAMFGDVIQNTTMEYIGHVRVTGMSPYLDLVAFTVTVVVVVIASVGVTCLVHTNTIFTIANLASLLVVIGLGFWKADWTNWSSEALGGFLPYGWQGVAAGTATLFYTFVGFESITSAAEEASDPATQIPVATMMSILFTTVIYVCSGACLTLMIPFTDIDINSPFPSALRDLGLDWAVYLVVIGALLGISTSLLADTFALPRNIYAMASDGLFFRSFASVHPETQTPLVATVVFGMLTAVLALLLEYQTLIEFMSIGTLVSFTVVAICVIVHRYHPADHVTATDQSEHSPQSETNSGTCSAENRPTEPVLLEDFKNNRFLSSLPGSAIIYASILTIIASTVVLSSLLKYNSFYDIYGANNLWLLGVLFLGMMGIFTALFFLAAFEEINEPTTFSVPLLPHTPALSIMINVALLVQLPESAWIRYAVWVGIGLLIYFLYGIRHSTENRTLAETGHHSLVSYSALARNDELSNDP